MDAQSWLNGGRNIRQKTGAELRIALFFTRTYARLLRPKLAEIMAPGPPPTSQLQAAFDRLQAEIERACRDEKLAA